MVDNFVTVASQVAVLFILLGVGALSGKTGLLNDGSIRGLTDFQLMIIAPCLIVDSYNIDFDRTMLHGVLITVVAALVFHLMNIVLAGVLVRDPDKGRQTALRFGVVFSNCGYMAIPLQNALLGSEGVFYGALFVAVFNIFLWTYGITVMSGGRDNVTIKSILLNPSIVAIVIGIALFVSPFRLPEVLALPIGHIAAMNTPVPMIIIGYQIYRRGIHVNGMSVASAIFTRLVVSPLILLGGLYLCGIRGSILIVCAVAASAPFAAATTMFSSKYGAGDVAVSAGTVSLSTLLSIITMPLIVGAAMALA